MASTIKDIAKETGLSLSTISKYLNGGVVRAKNRAAIERAIVKFDFRPNEIARGLRSARTKTVGVLVPSFRSVFNGEIASSLEKYLAGYGYAMFMVESGGSHETEKQKLDFLARKMVDGIIVHATHLKKDDFDEIVARKIPLVLLDQDVEGVDADKVFVDNYRATKEATTYLLSAGHEKIGFVGGPKDHSFTAMERYRGYRSAIENTGKKIENKYVKLGEYAVENGYESTRQLLKTGVSALLYANYDLTLGGIYALNEKGINIGEDVSVIGFDDIFFSKLVKPTLSAISQPMDQIACAAAELVAHRIQDESLPFETRVLRTAFVKGNSVKEIK